MGAKGKKQLSPKDFNQIKSLRAAKVSVPTIVQLTGWSNWLIYKVLNSSDFQDYKQRISRTAKPKTNKFVTKGEVIGAVEFAVVKEYFEANADISGVASVTGLSQKVVREIKEAPHYKAYMESLKRVHRQQIAEAKPVEEVKAPVVDVELHLKIDKLLQNTANIETALNTLLEHEDAKHANESVNGWRFGKSR